MRDQKRRVKDGGGFSEKRDALSSRKHAGKFPLLIQEIGKLVKERKISIQEAERFLSDIPYLRMRRAMQTQTAIKTFEVKEGSIRGGRYRITVTFRGKVIKVFTKDTMRQARMAFYGDGYELLAWAEGRKRICQDQNFE